MTPTIFARVLESFERLNPDHRPTVLFGPGVGESIWFAEQFVGCGISAAHIDGEHIWHNRRIYKTSRQGRDDILGMSKDGRVKVLCNRFVLRESIDATWLEHGIFATVFGSLQSYLQSGGHLLRSCERLTTVTVQDHGGNWHRHGSLNADRKWSLDFTASIVSGLRTERLRSKEEREPCRCPECGMILARSKCPCGFDVPIGTKSRPVIQSDGTMKMMSGDIYKARRIRQRDDAGELCQKMYYRAWSKKWNATFLQAEAMFASENNWGYPPRTLPLMPTDPLDWFRRVSDVPFERLIPKQ